MAAAALPLQEAPRLEVQQAARDEVAPEMAAAVPPDNKLREPVAAPAPVRHELVAVRGAKELEASEREGPEAKQAEVFPAPVETVVAQGRAAGAPREPAASPVQVA